MNITANILSGKKDSLYWKCQFIGWGMVSFFWAYVAFFRDDYGYFHTFLNYVLDVSLGIGLTHMYRFYARKLNWNQLNLNQLLWRIIPSILILAILFMLGANLKWHYYWVEIGQKDFILPISLLSWNPVFITGLRMMSIWILAYHLYHFYQREIESTKANAQLALIAKQAQLDNLFSQLNPHFLFNSLNSIKSLIIENPDKARRAIDLLSDLLRSSLYEKNQDLVSLEQELSLVNDYVELEKLRFEERLSVVYKIDESLMSFKVPPLCIQLLVENSIKHGIDKQIEGGEISVVISKIHNDLFIQVTNPGSLKTNSKLNGLGLKNLKDRLQLQYKGGSDFTLKESSNHKIKAVLILPVLNDDNL